MKLKPISIRKLLSLSLSAILVVSLFAGAALATSGTLPGGTAIEVVNDDPVDGTVFYAGAGGTVDITDSGYASVEAGIPLKNTTVVYVMDRSGSMTLTAGVDCDGDTVNDNRDVCAQIGVAEANKSAADYYSSIGLTGIPSFNDAGATNVVDLAPGGTALLVAPDYDGNGNTIADLEDVAFTLGGVYGTATNYADGLQKAVDTLNDPANTSDVNIILFLSDADSVSSMVGLHVSSVTIPDNTTIHTFGMGVGPSCTYDGGTGSLNDIAGMSTAGTGTCQIVSDMSELADFITESLGSTLDSLEISVDGGAATPIPNTDISLPLPQDGPVSVTYATPVTGLGVGEHEICVTAHGTDAGGATSITDCKTITVSPVEVSKHWSYTNVCFEVDNDGDGKLSEDPIDFDAAGNPIDNDGDLLYNEDPDECDETYEGDPLPMDGDYYLLKAVLSNTGKIKNYNPGQFYAVSTVEVLTDVDSLTIVEDFTDCVDEGLCQLNPKKGGGKVVVVDANGPDLVQVLDAMDVEVTVSADGKTVTVELGPMSPGTYMVYVKFGPGDLKGETFVGPYECTNVNYAEGLLDSASAGDEATALLKLIEKVRDE